MKLIVLYIIGLGLIAWGTCTGSLLSAFFTLIGLICVAVATVLFYMTKKKK